MADISDIEQVFADNIASAIYPEGTSQASVLGTLCRIYRGWPNAATLTWDLTSGIINITILADNESGHNTTRYLSEWKVTPTIPGTNIYATGQVIYVGGTPVVGDVVGALIDQVAYTYRVRAGDTAVQVAAELAQAIQADQLVSLSYTTILIHDASIITTRVVSDTIATMESRRQEKDVRITCWCSNPTIRDAAASTLDQYLTQTSFLVLPDNTEVRISYKNTASYDQAQNALLYRRDLVYTVEYSTVSVSLQPSMLFGDVALNGSFNYG